MDEDDDAWPRPHQGVEAALEELGLRFQETEGNPVFVWQALARQRPRRLYAKYNGRPIPPLIVPTWAEEYLLKVASRLSGLSDGLRIKRSKTGPWLTDVVVEDPTASMKDVTAALLGLTGQGENAFKNYQSHLRDEWTDARIAELQRSGKTREDAVEHVKQESGSVEASVIAKRAARGRRFREQLKALRSKPTETH